MIVKLNREAPAPLEYTVLATEEAEQPEAWSLKKQCLVTLLVYLLVIFVRTIQVYSIPATSPDMFLDAATILFPHSSTSAPRTLNEPYHVSTRPDIESWFFDLGGSSCACTLQWDRKQYWQRLFYGQKFVLAHVMTAFTGPFFVPCWEWNTLYKVFNEVLEELALPVYGKWAGSDEPMNVETRYDSLINDLVLSGFVFIMLGTHAVYVLQLPSIATYNLRWDLPSCLTLFTAFFQYYVLQSVQTLWLIFGFRTYKTYIFGFLYLPGNVFAFVLQIAYLRLIWLMRAWRLDIYYKTVFLLVLLWTPFTFFTEVYTFHEQIQAILSFALTGISVSVYQYCLHIGSEKILCFASICYVLAMIFYLSLQLGLLIPVPGDRYYYQQGGCGISNHSVAGACQALTMARA